MDIKVLLGKKIQEIRKSKNFTQENMAELLGIETSSLSNIERGKYYPTAENLAKIADILDVEPFKLYIFNHNKSIQELKSDINEMLEKADENELRMVYKVLNSILNY